MGSVLTLLLHAGCWKAERETRGQSSGRGPGSSRGTREAAEDLTIQLQPLAEGELISCVTGFGETDS